MASIPAATRGLNSWEGNAALEGGKGCGRLAGAEAPLLTCPQLMFVFVLVKSSSFSKFGFHSEAGGEVKEGALVAHTSALLQGSRNEQPEEQWGYCSLLML